MNYSLKPCPKFNLFSMCLHFVAENISMVDSLHDFPSLIGQELFQKCLELNKFEAASNLNLFAWAYPDEIFTSINFSNHDLMEYERLLAILPGCRLTELNLYNTDLISSGVNLIELVRSSCNTLVKLGLGANNLNDDYIRKFTLPIRLDLVAFDRLIYLDLSENPRLTQLSLTYLNKFKCLNEVVIDTKSVDTNSFEECKCLDRQKPVIKTDGWMNSIYLSSLKTTVSLTDRSNNKSELSFYKRPQLLSSSSSSSNKLKSTNKGKSNHLKKKCKCFNAKSDSKNLKRGRDLRDTDRSKSSFHISQCKKEIDDLLKLYS